MKTKDETHTGTQSKRLLTGEGGHLIGSRSGPLRYIQRRKIFCKGEGIKPAADNAHRLLKRLAKKKRGLAGIAGPLPVNAHGQQWLRNLSEKKEGWNNG